MITALVALLVACLPYWPCGTRGLGAEYDRHRILVVDTVGVKDSPARQEWNACASGVTLVRGPRALANTPGTITILPGERGDWPRGGWAGDHGVVLLPPGSWERSVPVIAHELGHALGFNHTRLDSVMGGRNQVQPLDCRGLRATYRR